MKVMITGSDGQLSRCFHITKPAMTTVSFLSRAALDITSADDIQAALQRESPDYVINCAAYTQVDAAESHPAKAELINHHGVHRLAEACLSMNIRVIHISTDFVFDGRLNTPYQPDQSCHPLNVYGASKRRGEQALLAVLQHNALLLRTSWLYSEFGNNFVKTMLRLMAERSELDIIHDQLGSPTYARGLAETIWQILSAEQWISGIFHWSDLGQTSWHGFATAIAELAISLNILNQPIPLRPILSSQYLTKARRPAYSVLDCSKLVTCYGIPQIPWEAQLERMLLAYQHLST